MGIRFEVIYDNNPLGIYYAGQIVRGRAIIHLKENIAVKGVKLRMRGYAKVRWDDNAVSTDPKNKAVVGEYYRSDEERFFENTTECIHTKDDVTDLAAGTHTYTFECHLPPLCPSTFEGTYGRIRYDTKIIIERSLMFNKSHSMEFNVLQMLDLNSLPILRIPAKMEVMKYFCCGPCISKPLIISLGLPQTGYVSGEFIHFIIKVVNSSSTMVRQVRFVLNLIALYSEIRRKETWSEKIPIAKKDFGPFEADDFEIKDTMRVPPTPPTSEEHCKVIKISYEIEVTASYNGAHKSSVISIPITIGNVPFIANLNGVSEDTLIGLLNNRIATGRHFNLNFEMPSPSYKKALYVKTLKPTIKKEPLFIPRYPFYNY
ncbi:arrestin domain-containing protein 3-like [Eupeodes corollae]|uniref:arrestin domain-containing protein 3-like n=1 Tax=Eupeodes corollae TaxID=290404 RepID=UPI0024900DA2|nr:arrestin domain-containing protein 3-like [Eupeodes corollae]